MITAISHFWYAFHREVERIKQLLTCPMAFIEKHVQKLLEQKCLQAKPPNSDEPPPPVELFFQNQMSENYKQDEQKLVKLLKKGEDT